MQDQLRKDTNRHTTKCRMLSRLTPGGDNSFSSLSKLDPAHMRLSVSLIITIIITGLSTMQLFTSNINSSLLQRLIHCFTSIIPVCSLPPHSRHLYKKKHPACLTSQCLLMALLILHIMRTLIIMSFLYGTVWVGEFGLCHLCHSGVYSSSP